VPVAAFTAFGLASLENILPELKTVLPHADFVIEGYVDPREPLRDEGPFGDHTGYYTLPEPDRGILKTARNLER
jgi:UbiD family decarboxylase